MYKNSEWFLAHSFQILKALYWGFTQNTYLRNFPLHPHITYKLSALTRIFSNVPHTPLLLLFKPQAHVLSQARSPSSSFRPQVNTALNTK